jgi:hypothetical protein
MNLGRAAGVVFLTWAGCSALALAAPQADLASSSWQLDFEFTDPQRITVQGETYWYMVYRVTNRTGKEVEFFPLFRLVTNTLQEVIGGEGVNPLVYESIAKRHRGDFPFFALPAKITGPILQGEENARESAVVFKTFDREAARFTVFVSGLSGEIETTRNPAFDKTAPESESNPRMFLFRRTLAIVYDIPGDSQTRATATPIRRTRSWEMR